MGAWTCTPRWPLQHRLPWLLRVLLLERRPERQLQELGGTQGTCRSLIWRATATLKHTHKHTHKHKTMGLQRMGLPLLQLRQHLLRWRLPSALQTLP